MGMFGCESPPLDRKCFPKKSACTGSDNTGSQQCVDVGDCGSRRQGHTSEEENKQVGRMLRNMRAEMSSIPFSLLFWAVR